MTEGDTDLMTRPGTCPQAPRQEAFRLAHSNERLPLTENDIAYESEELAW
jgi:hypothetical protein